jgi:hypothetical protein
MQTNLTIQTDRRVRVVTQILAALVLAGFTTWSVAAIDPDQSKVSAPAGDGWQVLSSTPATSAPLSATVPAVASSVAPTAAPPLANPTPLAVTPVVLPGAASVSASVLTLTITPQDVNLRNALDRWLQTQGWQLAWNIGDDLPLEFNATFTGDFDHLLEEVMRATNHMQTPTRICEHTNSVVRVIARAASCKD